MTWSTGYIRMSESILDIYMENPHEPVDPRVCVYARICVYKNWNPACSGETELLQYLALLLSTTTRLLRNERFTTWRHKLEQKSPCMNPPFSYPSQNHPNVYPHPKTTLISALPSPVHHLSCFLNPFPKRVHFTNLIHLVSFNYTILRVSNWLVLSNYGPNISCGNFTHIRCLY